MCSHSVLQKHASYDTETFLLIVSIIVAALKSSWVVSHVSTEFLSSVSGTAACNHQVLM